MSGREPDNIMAVRSRRKQVAYFLAMGALLCASLLLRAGTRDQRAPVKTRRTSTVHFKDNHHGNQMAEKEVSNAVSRIRATSSKSSYRKYLPMPKIAKGAADVPVILFWNNFFGGDYGYDTGTKYTRNHCREGNVCEFTYDKSRLSESAAILVHTGASEVIQPLPSDRQPWQRVVFYNHEKHAKGLEVNRHFVKNVFNWTMTYRLDADIYMPYGVALPIKRQTIKTANYAENKKGLIFSLISNCDTESKRHMYINELKKYVTVDSYGKCYWNSCGRRSTDGPGCPDIAKHYKFYLAFENSVCKDYVTEKVYRYLVLGLVPIVLGGGDYKKALPSNSFVDIADFDSAEDLAVHLKRVDEDDALYNKYFAWRDNYEIATSRAPAVCELCRRLRDPTELYQTYTDIVKWYTENTCVHPAVKYPHLSYIFSRPDRLNYL